MEQVKIDGQEKQIEVREDSFELCIRSEEDSEPRVYNLPYYFFRDVWPIAEGEIEYIQQLVIGLESDINNIEIFTNIYMSNIATSLSDEYLKHLSLGQFNIEETRHPKIEAEFAICNNISKSMEIAIEEVYDRIEYDFYTSKEAMP